MSVQLGIVLLALLFASAQTVSKEPQPEAAIETVRTFVKAIETADVELMATTFADDATVFMPGGGPTPQPERRNGKPEVVESFRGMFERIRKQAAGPQYATIATHDLRTQVYDDIVIVTLHLRAVPAQPVTEAVSFPRRSFVLRRAAERWLIVHLHASNVQLTPPEKGR